MPLTIKIIQTKLGHPLTGSPYNNVLIIINTIIIKLIIKNKNPITAEITKGLVEKAHMPSMAYINNFQKLHLDSPATLFIFSYSNHLVLKPTKLKSPFEYLLYS